MSILQHISETDRMLVQQELMDFLPDEIYDIHAHPFHPDHYGNEAYQWLGTRDMLDCATHLRYLKRYMGDRLIHGLYFAGPHLSAVRDDMNNWVHEEVEQNGTPKSLVLKLITPEDDREQARRELREGKFAGFKVYHIYAGRPDTMQASVVEYASEWMWEILDEFSGILMLHIVRDGAMDDKDNQQQLRRLCLKYPNAKVILAHVARSFNYRNGRAGLSFLEDLDNVWVDTSAVTESESFKAALQALGPRRILWGSDFPVSELRGRCITTGNYFFWLHPEVLDPGLKAPTNNEMTLIGIESLLCLKEACLDMGLTRADIEDIFLNNSLRLLNVHLLKKAGRDAVPTAYATGPRRWQETKTQIPGGTGLLSKRAEMYDVDTWPAFFERAKGAYVWDLDGRRYIDFAGGVGAVLLGYADPEVVAAARRRIEMGSYCTLVNPQEKELADRLLQLHPWASKVQYARGGGEAMTVAVRLARAATGKSGVIFCGYHGWHDWYLAANLGEAAALDGHLLPGLEPKGVPRELKGTAATFRYNDLRSLDVALQQMEGKLASIVMEPVRSQWPVDGFLQAVQERCRKAGAVFIVDEITSGLRFGFPGALSRFGVEPDVVVYAKAMSNGFPFGTIVGKDWVMQEAVSSFVSSSYWTDGVGTAAALAVLDKMEQEGVAEAVWNKGETLVGRLQEIAARYPRCCVKVSGMPAAPVLAFDLGKDTANAKRLYVRKMQQRGILVSSIFYVMAAHTTAHFEQLYTHFDATLADIQALIDQGALQSEAGAGEALSGFARLT